MSNSIKAYVTVGAVFSAEGNLTPKYIIWEDGRKFEIDRIIDVRRAASLKAGGAGIRYTIRIGGTETFLFLEDTRWFVERRVS